ncbi:MAG: alpha,alpha-trehalose-phosphate synthase (UDP-forming) [Dehalococcoidia bacterium]
MENRQSLLDKKQERFRELCQRVLAERGLIFASNRGPVEYTITPDGTLQPQRGGGGLVIALSSVGRFIPLTWVASAMTEGDRRLAKEAAGRIRAPLSEQEVYLRFVVVPRSVYQRFYSVFSNPLLWFVQHLMWNTPRTPSIGRPVYEAWEQGYVPVNRAFARAVAEEAQKESRTPFIFLHDYHLYLAPGEIRLLLPDAPVLHFTHIPWPGPRCWCILPEFMRREIHQQMCAADIVGFQTRHDVRDFLLCCEEFLKGVSVDHRASTVAQDNWLTRVTYYPISIDAAGLCRFALSPEVQQYEEKISRLRREITIVRVDRAEPSKNIIRGFRAYDNLLDRYPNLRRRVVFLAFLVPSRGEVSIYRTYTKDLLELADAINAKYGDEEWQPVHIFYEDNYAQAIAAMRLYDILLVNPVIDGMNLVAKEGPLVNTRDGVLILSEMAGAHEQLGEYALSICPTDLEGTVRALHAAINMPAEERRRRAAALRRAIQEEDITFWLERQFRDLMAVSRRRL